MKPYLTGILMAVAVQVTYADTTTVNKNPLILGFRAHYGFIIPHAQSIRAISFSHPWSLEADVSRLMTDDKAWDYCHCYPRIGLSLTYTNFDNPAVLGSALTSLLYVEPFLTYHRKFNVSFRTGIGLAYLTNPYDFETNADNLFFSTPISFLLQANLGLNYRLTDVTSLRLIANYSHISNGGIKEPNKGINYPTISFGVDHHFHAVPPENRTRVRQSLPDRRKTSAQATLFSTAKTIGGGEPQRYWVIGLAGSVHRVISRKSALHAGAECVADGTVREQIRRSSATTAFHRVAALVGHDLLIGRFTFSQTLGVYVYAPYRAKDPVYQRYGLTFKLTDSVFIGVNLKAHRDVADFLDARVGIVF